MESNKIIHCIGDSHASFFSGYDQIQPTYPEASINKFPFFRSYRLGAVLAYSLNKLNTNERGREKLLMLINELPPKSELLLCFGEIDCRCHLVKHSKLSGEPLTKVVEDCVINYFKVVDELKEAGFHVMIWNVIPTADAINNEYPTFGSHAERNQCTSIFNKILQRKCRERGLLFLSIFDKLMTKKFKTRRVCFFDAVHLGQISMPFVFKRLLSFKPQLTLHGYSKVEIEISVLNSILIVMCMTVLLDGKVLIKKIFKRSTLHD